MNTPLFEAILAAVVVLSAYAPVRSLIAERRLARLEQKLDRLLNHFQIISEFPQIGTGNTQSAPATEDLMELVRRGKKIEAVKLYRQQNPGADLREAKDVVDSMERVVVAKR